MLAYYEIRTLFWIDLNFILIGLNFNWITHKLSNELNVISLKFTYEQCIFKIMRKIIFYYDFGMLI